MAPIIPAREEDEELVPTSTRLPPPLVDTLDFITDSEVRNRYSRNDIIIHLLQWSSQRYVEEKGLEEELKRFLERRRVERELAKKRAVEPRKPKR